MMDPVSSVGVAAAALQFFGSAFKAATLCKEIYESEKSATVHNTEIKDFIASVHEARAKLARDPPAGTSQAILDVVHKYDPLAVKLLGTYRAWRKEKKVENLERSLKDNLQALEQLLVIETWSTVKEWKAQGEELAKALDQLKDHMQGDDSPIAKELASIQNTIKDTATLMTKGFQDAESKQQQRHDQLLETQFRETFLRSLHFPEMDERQSNIKDAAPRTFEWVYSHLGLSFWLQTITPSDDGVYWISGKLGSGKSTLMAYIVGHSRTIHFLKKWSEGKALHILSFFFWRPGSKAQPAVIAPVLLELGWGSLGSCQPSLGVWTERNLRKAAFAAIRSALEANFCIFIDGLDEFSGDHNELLDFIFDIQQLPTAKVCVSSRPEAELARRLKHCQGLCMQDMNKEDIRQLVYQKLRVDDPSLRTIDINELTDLILTYAEGVFLWASLVTQSVLKGARSGDDIHMLRQRIKTSPREINDMFLSMLGEMDELHKSSFAFYVGIMQLIEEMGVGKNEDNVLNSIAVIAAAKFQDTKFDWASLSEMCRRTQLQIISQTMGLLVCPQGPSAKEHLGERIRVHSPDAAYPEPVCYRVSWVHRSAHDFLRDPAVFDKLNIRPISRATLLKRLTLAAVDYHTAPQHYGRGHNLYSLVESLGLAWNLCPTAVLEALDRLHLAVAMGPHEKDYSPSLLWSAYGFGAPIEYMLLRFDSIELSQLLDIFAGVKHQDTEREKDQGHDLSSDPLYQEWSFATMEEYQFVGICLDLYFETDWEYRLELQLVTNIPAEIYQMVEEGLVVKSIKENEQKLSASDQTLVLACIQVWFHRLFDRLEDFHLLFGSWLGVIPEILAIDGCPDIWFAKGHT
ncbi:small s protein [Apiospora sp. TS-2023a]